MWGFQQLFWAVAARRASRLFQLLDSRIEPRVFLVGARASEKEGDYPICLEPGDCEYEPLCFEELFSRVDAMLASPEWVHWSSSSEWERVDNCRRQYLLAVQMALSELLSEDSRSASWVSYCSAGVVVENHIICVVLQLERAIVESLPSLSRTQSGDIKLRRSLVDAAAIELLSSFAEELSKPQAGMSLLRGRTVEEIIRSAGNELALTAGFAAEPTLGIGDLCEWCNVISSMKYEGQDGIGEIVVARDDHPDIERDFTFTRQIDLRDYRAVRKLLQLGSKGAAVIANAVGISGIGRIKTSYDASREDVFVVRFVQHHTWELWHDKVALMRVTYNEPRLPKPAFVAGQFLEAMNAVFPSVQDAAGLLRLVQAATTCKHGAMLVISENPVNEAVRLESQAICVEPVKLTDEAVLRMVRIDGAVLLDKDGLCHAIGVILDGPSHEKCLSSRGARYNSAVRYVNGKKNCVAVVVSEDGMVDVLPDCRLNAPFVPTEEG